MPLSTPPGIVINETDQGRDAAAAGQRTHGPRGLRSEPGRVDAAAFRLVGVAQFPFDDEAQNTAVMSRDSAAGGLRRRTR